MAMICLVSISLLLLISDVNGFQCGFDDSSVEESALDRTTHENVNRTWYVWNKNSAGEVEVPYVFGNNIDEISKGFYREVFNYFEENISCLKFTEEQAMNTHKQLNLSVACNCSGDTDTVGGRVYGHAVYGQCSWNPWDHFLQCEELPDLVFLEMSVRPYHKDSSSNIIENRIWKNVLIHEIFHVFGIAHTQRRSDRHNYVKVLWNNIIENYHRQYDECQDCKIPTDKFGNPVPYECNSIMHYKTKTFKKKDALGPTMKAVDSRTCPTFGNARPTTNDWNSLKLRIGCADE